MVTCGKKERHQNEIEHGLNLGRRKKEKRNVRRKSVPGLKDNSPDRLGYRTSTRCTSYWLDFCPIAFFSCSEQSTVCPESSILPYNGCFFQSNHSRRWLDKTLPPNPNYRLLLFFGFLLGFLFLPMRFLTTTVSLSPQSPSLVLKWWALLWQFGHNNCSTSILSLFPIWWRTGFTFNSLKLFPQPAHFPFCLRRSNSLFVLGTGLIICHLVAYQVCIFLFSYMRDTKKGELIRKGNSWNPCLLIVSVDFTVFSF